MKMIILNCPACNAALEMDEADSYCICKFCGSKVIHKKTPFETDTKGNPETSPLLKRAFLFLEDSEFEKADQYFEKVLDMDPECSKAYIGKLLCQLNLHKIEDLANIEVFLTSYDYFKKAVRFASENERGEYENLKAEALNYHNLKKSEKEQEISDLQRDITLKEQYLSEEKNKYFLYNAKRVLWTILFVISICLVIFFTIGTIFVWPFVFFDIASVLWMLYMIRKIKKARLLISHYNDTKQQLEQSYIDLENKKAGYEYWLQMINNGSVNN